MFAGSGITDNSTQTSDRTRHITRQDCAFLDGVDVGAEAGYTVGWRDGYDRRDFEAMLAYGIAKAVISLPTKAELAKRRVVDNQPCAARCKICAKCVRFAAAWRNQRLYGSPDYPGVAEAARILAERGGRDD